MKRVLLALAACLVASSTVSCASTHSSPAPSRVEVVQTSADLSRHLTRMPDLELVRSRVSALPVIHVDDAVDYQRVVGFGATMTDTSAWLLDRHLSPSLRSKVMAKLFGPTGIGLNYLRVPIGASDYTARRVPYTYDDVPSGQSDPGLTRFSIAHDQAYILPVLRQALAINPNIEVLASPWTAPAWMKANKALDNVDQRGLLLPQAYQAFAEYVVKFIQAYAAAGVRVGAVTPENEPELSTLYPGMTLSAQSEADFLAGALQPALRAAGLDIRVYGFDFNWFLPAYPQALVADPRLAAIISGIAWHCYAGNPDVMTSLHSVAPALEQLETECSSGLAPGPPAEMAIASLRNWSTVVLLWNVALDRSGGPVQPPNMGCPGCTAPVTVDEPTSSVTYGVDYYQIGQLSSFVHRGAQRIESEHFVQYRDAFLNRNGGYATSGLDDVAFQNPDGGKVLVAYNNAPSSARFAVIWHGRWFAYTLPAGDTVTFLWR